VHPHASFSLEVSVSASPPVTRRRFALAAAAALLAAGALAVAGCGGESSTAADGTTAGYVPAGTPMYFEVTTDFDGPQWDQMREIGSRFPAYPRLASELREALTSGEVDFEEDVRPLLGERAAIAVTSLDALNRESVGTGPGAAASSEAFLGVVGIADGAREDLEALLVRTGSTAQGDVQGATLYVDGDDGTFVGVTDEVMLVADRREDIAAAMSANAEGGSAALAGTDQFTDTVGKLPDDVFGLAYVDVGAVVRAGGEALPAGAGVGGLGGLEDGVVGAAVVAETEGLRITGVSRGVEVNRNRSSFSPGFAANAPSDALVFAELADISTLIRDQVALAREGLDADTRGQIDALSGSLPDILGVSIDQISALGQGRQALVVTPGTGGTPGIVVLSRVDDPAEAQRVLDSVRERTPALLSLLGDGGPVPPASLWTRIEVVPGIQGWQLPLGDDMSIVYAIDEDLVVIGTSPEAVAASLEPAESLQETDGFTQGTSGMPDEVTSLSFINVAEVLTLARSMDAFADTDPEVEANLAQVRSIASWDVGGDEPTFEAFVRIGR
jgi:hypothetical protein